MIKVSVIIPAFNRGYILPEALGSVFAQTLQDFEVLVIDDGSQDNTAEVVQRFRDSRLRYIRHKRNRGYSAACNAGFREALGEYVSFLDSDDLWKKEKLKKEAAFLDRYLEVQAVFSDLEKQDRAKSTSSFMRATPYFSKLLAERNYPEEILHTQREIYLCLLREVPIKPSALTMRREAIEKIGYFNDSWPSGSDWEFLLRFSRLFRFGYMDQRLVVLRVQADATHRVHTIKAKPMLLNLLKNEIQQMRNDREAVSAAKWGYSDITKHLAWAHLANGQRSEAARVFARGFRVTGEVGLLFRALLAYFPENVRVALKKVAGRSGN